MGIWAGIKYALNSTLGTENFKPIDQIFLEQSKIVVSNELYESLHDMEIRIDKDEVDTIKATRYPSRLLMKRHGEFELRGKITRSTIKMRLNFNIYKNSELVFSHDMFVNQTETTESFSTIISVEPNDEISIYLSARATEVYGYEYARITNMAVYGTLKETAYLMIPSEEG